MAFLSPFRRVVAVALAALPLVLTATMAFGSEDSLPQARPEFFAGQLFWLAVAFTVLYVLLKRVALPRIAAVQETRATRRAADLAAADVANRNAKDTIAAYEKTLATARQQAQRQLTEIVQATQAQAAAHQAQHQAQLQGELETAEARIADLRLQAMAQVDEAAIEVAATMVKNLTGADSRERIAAAIAQLKRVAA